MLYLKFLVNALINNNNLNHSFLEKFMLKADLHLHTNLDKYDKVKYSPKELINYLAKLNFKVASITHHEQVYFNEEIKRYAESKDILLIPGAEAKIKGKHVLIYNINQQQLNKIKDFSDLEDLKKENSVIVAPHPFFIKNKCLGKSLLKNINCFDAIEYTHFYLEWLNLNKKAVRIAKEYNKTLIGNSDAHDFRQINKTYSLFNCKNSIDDVLEAIRKNKINVVSKPLDFFSFFCIALWGAFT